MKMAVEATLSSILIDDILYLTHAIVVEGTVRTWEEQFPRKPHLSLQCCMHSVLTAKPVTLWTVQ